MERPIRRNDHRAPDGNHVRRRAPVTPKARMQDAREAAGRIVSHDRPRLDAARLERLRLQLDVLDDRSPEGPRVRRHDADLHPTSNVCAEALKSFASRLALARRVVYVRT